MAEGMAHAADVALLIEVAQGAGRIATDHFGRGVRAWEKGDGQGPVTEADMEIDAYLHAQLRAARPGYGWLSEESDPPGGADRMQADATFIIDPIDGTRAFIDGQKGFAHALAVVRRGRPVAAVVHLPLMGLTYSARRGGGAWCNGVRIAASDRVAADGARILAARPALEARHWPGGMPELVRHFRTSLAWRLALVGAGAFDAMLTLRDAWDWDIAASALIATEAGARVTDRHGAALRFNRAQARNSGVLAAPVSLHGTLLRGLHGPAAPRPPSAQTDSKGTLP